MSSNHRIQFVCLGHMNMIDKVMSS